MNDLVDALLKSRAARGARRTGGAAGRVFEGVGNESRSLADYLSRTVMAAPEQFIDDTSQLPERVFQIPKNLVDIYKSIPQGVGFEALKYLASIPQKMMEQSKTAVDEFTEGKAPGPVSPELVDTSTEAALEVGGGGLVLGQGPKNAAGMFMGRKAKHAPHDKIDEAEYLSNSWFGGDQDDIRKSTGVTFNDDGIPSWELSDHAASYNAAPAGTTLTLSKYLNHPEFFENYPHLADVPVYVRDPSTLPKDVKGQVLTQPKNEKMFIAADNPPRDTLATVLHETQHLVDRFEGNPSGHEGDTVRYRAARLLKEGADEDVAADPVAQKYYEGLMASNTAEREALIREDGFSPEDADKFLLERLIDRVSIEGGDPRVLTKLRYDLEEIDSAKLAALDYAMDRGENVARATENRMDLNDIERQYRSPEEDYPVRSEFHKYNYSNGPSSKIEDVLTSPEERTRELTRLADADYPVTAYHGTPRSFDQFSLESGGDLGHHFGTRRQAEERLETVVDVQEEINKLLKAEGSPAEEINPRVIEARLRKGEPVRMEDVGNWDNPVQVSGAMRRAGLFGPESDEWVRGQEAFASGDSRGAFDAMRGVLLNKGHSGVVYENEAEGVVPLAFLENSKRIVQDLSKKIDSGEGVTPSEWSELWGARRFLHENSPRDSYIALRDEDILVPGPGSDELARQRRMQEGYPVEAYHGTTYGPPSSFQDDDLSLGVHVGTQKAANDRLNQKRDGDLNDTSVMPLQLADKKMLEMGDMDDDWSDPRAMAEALHGALPEKYDNTLQGMMDPATSGTPGYDILTLKGILKDEGYGGISYVNDHEDRGSISRVIFDPADIRSRHALFDPAKKSSRNLLASILAGGLAAPLADYDLE